MTFPLDEGTYSIGDSFQDHLNAGGDRARYPGQDFPSAEGNKAKAIESGNIYMLRDGFGANYIVLYGKTGMWFYVHLSRFEGGNRYVNEGEVIGYVGHTGYAFGNHLHLGLQIGGVYVNPQLYLKSSNSNNNSYIPQMNNYDKSVYGNPKYVVVSNDSCSSIVQKLGLPDTEHNWAHLAELNGYSANDYKIFNSRLQVGQTLNTGLNLAPSPAVDSSKEIQALKTQIEAIKKQNDEANAILKKQYEAKIIDITRDRDTIALRQKELLQRDQELQDELKQFHDSMNVDLGIVVPIFNAVIDEEAKNRNWKQKYQDAIDKFTTNQLLRSILKYDWAYLLFTALTTMSVFLDSIHLDPSLKVLIFFLSILSSIVSIALKLLFTYADKNGDKKVDKADTTILKNFDIKL